MAKAKAKRKTKSKGITPMGDFAHMTRKELEAAKLALVITLAMAEEQAKRQGVKAGRFWTTRRSPTKKRRSRR